MEKKTASAIMLTLLLTSMLTLVFSNQLVKAESEVIIDTHGDSRFAKYPSGPYWWSVADHDVFHTRAYNNNFWYTYCGAPGQGDLYFGTWQASLPQSGEYEVFVWIPNPDAFGTYTPTQSANYQVYHQGGLTEKTVNQRLRTGGWYSLGRFTFGTSATIMLNDRTGEPYLSTMIAFDAIKFVYVAPQDFSITASPTSLTIQQGSSGSSTITITSINGFNQPVQLGIFGAPSGVTATLNPSQITPPTGGTATSTLTVSVGTTATPGSYTLTVTGTSGALTHSTYISLQIPPPANQPPSKPTAVSQCKSDGVTVIPEVGTTPESTVVFKATVSDPDGDSVRLEIELRQMGEPFTGQPTPETISDYVSSGTQVTITRYGLVNADYHWRYRAKDIPGATSDWTEFGAVENIDFRVNVPSARAIVDLFTQKAPFDGKGPNQPSDSFQPQELVVLYALVTCNEAPVENKLVAFQINGPPNPFQNITMVGSSSTNQSGIAMFSFRIPSLESPNAEQTVLGEWFALATVEVAGQLVVDTLTFPVATLDFSITASPNSLSIQQGTSGSSMITVTSINGFNQPVQLTVSGAPSGVTATLNPQQVTPPAGGSTTSTLTVSVATSATPGTYTLTVTGTSGALTHNTYVSLEITANIPNYPPDCAVKLREGGVEISKIDVGQFFDIYVGDSAGDVGSASDEGIVKVRFSSDDVYDPFPTGVWTEWYDWDSSSGDWDATTKIRRWAFYTPGNKDVWAEVMDDAGQTDKCHAQIFANPGYAVIVAGQADFRQKWAIDQSANNAYRALYNLGFDHDHISYLNAELQQIEGVDVVDRVPSILSLQYSLDEIKLKIGDNSLPQLVLYFVGHGIAEVFDFYTNTDPLDSGTLREMLAPFPENRMLVVFGVCYSGSFITLLIAGGTDSISRNNRIIITAAHDHEERHSLLGVGGVYHSMDRFWGNLDDGLNVKDAFTANTWPGDLKHMWLDDNGDNIGNPPDPNNMGSDGALASATIIGVPGTANLKFAFWNSIHIGSAGELRVYDSQNRVTGLVNGEIKENIPNSLYDAEDKTVAIFSPLDIYRYEIVGTQIGSFGLDIALVEGNEAAVFTAIDIPITSGMVQHYSVDWDALSQGEEGVTVQVDSTGDGVFEHTFTSDSELTQSEFLAATASSSLSVSMSPLSASLLAGQSLTFTSTASGGVIPYAYQWFLNSAPVSGATSASWTFTRSTSGIYYVYLKVTDASSNTSQSETARITVATIPVGGYSIAIRPQTKAEPVLPYIAFVATLTAIFTKLRPKTKRKR